MSDGSSGTILLVESDAQAGKQAEGVLSLLGHRVSTVSEATQALAEAAVRDFDLLVINYQLTEAVNGLDLYLVLRERGHSIPTVLITDFDDTELIVRAMRAGVRDFLPKGSDYHHNLPLTVERVLRQVAAERRAADSNLIREKQALLEAAFDAAALAAWVWDYASDSLRWTGRTSDIFGFDAAERCPSMRALIAAVHPEDRELFADAVHSARSKATPFFCQVRVTAPDGELRWFTAKGRVNADQLGRRSEVIGVLCNVTQRKRAEIELQQSYHRIHALNERLQLAVAEAHHRIKNSLQQVVSLVNLEFRGQGTLSQDAVSKLISHIQGFAMLHDILVEQAREHELTPLVAVDQIFERLTAVLNRSAAGRLSCEVHERCLVTARRAASLAVVFNELVSNALKHGEGKVTITVERAERTGVLRVQNETGNFPPPAEMERRQRTGLPLIQLLCSTDLECEPTFENHQDGSAEARIKFPCEPDPGVAKGNAGDYRSPAEQLLHSAPGELPM